MGGSSVAANDILMRQEVERIERCEWFDISLGFLKEEKKLTQKVENQDSVIDPNSMVAFNFDHDIKKREEERANDNGTAVTSVRLKGSLA